MKKNSLLLSLIVLALFAASAKAQEVELDKQLSILMDGMLREGDPNGSYLRAIHARLAVLNQQDSEQKRQNAEQQRIKVERWLHMQEAERNKILAEKRMATDMDAARVRLEQLLRNNEGKLPTSWFVMNMEGQALEANEKVEAPVRIPRAASFQILQEYVPSAETRKLFSSSEVPTLVYGVKDPHYYNETIRLNNGRSTSVERGPGKPPQWYMQVNGVMIELQANISASTATFNGAKSNTQYRGVLTAPSMPTGRLVMRSADMSKSILVGNMEFENANDPRASQWSTGDRFDSGSRERNSTKGKFVSDVAVITLQDQLAAQNINARSEAVAYTYSYFKVKAAAGEAKNIYFVVASPSNQDDYRKPSKFFVVDTAKQSVTEFEGKADPANRLIFKTQMFDVLNVGTKSHLVVPYIDPKDNRSLGEIDLRPLPVTVVSEYEHGIFGLRGEEAKILTLEPLRGSELRDFALLGPRIMGPLFKAPASLLEVASLALARLDRFLERIVGVQIGAARAMARGLTPEEAQAAVARGQQVVERDQQGLVRRGNADSLRSLLGLARGTGGGGSCGRAAAR